MLDLLPLLGELHHQNERDTGILYYKNGVGWGVRALTAGTGITLTDGGILGALTISTTLTLAAGVYNPTLTNVANLDASTSYEAQYMRVGNTVTVSGKVDADPTAPAASTQLGISLPIASNIGAVEDVGGAAFASGIAGQGAGIFGDLTNNRAEMRWVAGDVTNQPMHYVYSYTVI